MDKGFYIMIITIIMMSEEIVAESQILIKTGIHSKNGFNKPDLLIEESLIDFNKNDYL